MIVSWVWPDGWSSRMTGQRPLADSRLVDLPLQITPKLTIEPNRRCHVQGQGSDFKCNEQRSTKRAQLGSETGDAQSEECEDHGYPRRTKEPLGWSQTTPDSVL
jgi:hypothetical protein